MARSASSNTFSPLEVGFAVPEFDSGELAPQYLDHEVATAACWLQKAGVNPFSFVLHQVKHGFYHPRGGEYLAVVSDALFGLDEAHEFAISCGKF